MSVCVCVCLCVCVHDSYVYILGPNGGTCTICPAGKFKAAMGSAACSECEAGKFSDADAARLCTSCPLNSNSVAGSDAAQDCACAPGFTGVCVCVCVCGHVCAYVYVCVVCIVYACMRVRRHM